MHPLQLYNGFKKEIRFPYQQATRNDYIRGALLVGTALIGIGLPTFIGYLIFLLKAQGENAEFLPPITPETIGDYTYIGFKYLVFLLGVISVLIGYTWGLIQIELVADAVRAGIFVFSMFAFIYVLPVTVVLYAKTGVPFPQSRDEGKAVIDRLRTYEYSTVILFSIFGGLLFSLILTITSLFIVTIPLTVVVLWYLSIVFVRVLGYATFTEV